VTFTVSVTVDVDGEAGLPGGGAAYEARLSSRSERAYGVRRGLPRVLAVLREFRADATFYVPGVTAQRHPDEVRAIVAAGHEVGHHGHLHVPPHELSVAEQRADVHAGMEAIEAITGIRPEGYRAPGWELTPATLDALVELGLSFDSSLMGDDRAHTLHVGDHSLVELPVHWSLDDAPHFARSGNVTALLSVWHAELRAAHDERRHVTFTLHPDIAGRPSRIELLRRLLDAVRALDAEIVTHGRAAAAHAGRV
jgi:peptidoglycan-N-acetylglucosamine deacetylase